ncbi:MAG: IS110 family transposase [Acidimicrobiia bacterium]|nr:IS110 family transposase [Acidimicrobiia bacterium]
MIFVGNDWSEGHHDVCVVTSDGQVVARDVFDEGIDGVAEFHALMADLVEDPDEVAGGIETDRGLWVDMLVACGYHVYALNPKSVARFREGRTLSGAKSDRGDAKMLADLVRLDRYNHREVAGDSNQVGALKVMTRTHQTLIWERQRATNRLRAGLVEYFPAAVKTFDDLKSRDAVAILTVALTPAEGKALTMAGITSALKDGGRQRYIQLTADKIRNGLQVPHLEAPEPVTAGYRAAMAPLVGMIGLLNTQIDELANEIKTVFRKHPDAAIYLSLPGVGDVLGARLLAEFGDDPERYVDGKSRRNYAATSPVTKASGTQRSVHARWIRNDRLHDAVIQIVPTAARTSAGFNALYRQRRAQGDTHTKAARRVGNRFVGILHGCLETRTLYDEQTAWGHRFEQQNRKAA